MPHGAVVVGKSSVVVAAVAAAGFVPPLSEWRPPHWRSLCCWHHCGWGADCLMDRDE